MEKHVDRVYCSNCSKKLHNVYEYMGNKIVKLVKRRCKGEIFDQIFKNKDVHTVIKCECKCQTHYIYRGYLVPIGQTPKAIDKMLEKRKPKPLDLKTIKMLQEWRSKNEGNQPPSLKKNPWLGTVGSEKDHIVEDGDENVGGGYLFQDDVVKMGKN